MESGQVDLAMRFAGVSSKAVECFGVDCLFLVSTANLFQGAMEPESPKSRSEAEPRPGFIPPFGRRVIALALVQAG